MTLAVSINPSQVVMDALTAQTFVATVSGGAGAVVWSVDGIAGGDSTVGTIVAGVYTAPSLTGNHVVTASVTVGATTAFANAAVTVLAYSPASSDVLTFGTHLTGGTYNGTAPVTIATDATSANTASTIVARDASGNFSAGKVTASSILLSTLPPIYANNAAAIAGGLTAGEIFRVGGDPDQICVVH